MKHLTPLFIALLALAVLLPTPAGAQEVERTSQIHVVVFGPPQGLPLAEVDVEIGEQSVETNADGAAWVQVAPGSYDIEVSAPDLPVATVEGVQVAAGEGAEVIVELREDGEFEADIETVELGEGSEQMSDEQKEELGPPGTLAGTVVSFDEQQPIGKARVFVRGLADEAVTDAYGRFEMQVPPGSWDVSVIHPEYSTESETGVRVESETKTEIEVEMTPAAVRLDAYTVTIPRIEGGTISLLEERKETSQVADVIGAEQFSKAGDSDAASALGRVTGLTVVDGKYVYVRGLGERYSSSLLNGSMLPSPNPERRVVPLDLFPTSVLESVVVQKTYSADMPGGFGGGVIRMRTRSFPSEFTASADLSLGYGTQTTFQDGLGYQGGSLDWLGFDDGTRALPQRVRDAAAQSALKPTGRFSDEGFTKEELAAIGRTMPDNYAVNRSTVMPDIGVSGTLGDTAELFDLDVGYLFSLGYDYDHDRDLWQETYYNPSRGGERLSVASDLDLEGMTDTVTLSGIFAGGVKFDENNIIEATTLLSRISEDDIRRYSGTTPDATLRVAQLQWVERQLFFQQLTGEHTLPGLGDAKLDWRYGFGQASRYEPDRREYRYDYEEDIDDFAFSTRPDGNARVWSDLVDYSHDAGISATIPFEVWSSLDAEVKTGADFYIKTREVDTRRFGFDDQSPAPKEERTRPIEQLLNDESINADGGYVLGETTRETDNYTGEMLMAAGYVLTELPLTESLGLAAGVRFEQSSIEVNTFKLFSDDEPVQGRIANLNILPSASLTWKFAEKMQLRGAVARTVNRPDFRELSPACYRTVIGSEQVCGNQELERAEITHLDARWEWYPDRGESVSVGVFYKDFTKPIEVVAKPAADPTASYRNADGAINYGVEFDARKELDFMSDWTRDFYLAGNLAFIASEIQLPRTFVENGEELEVRLTNFERPLQGQSPFVLNMQFGYDNPDAGTTATLLYNVYGERITQVSREGKPDIYEQPDHIVDFVFSQRLSDSFEMGLKARNLLGVEQVETVGDFNAYNQTEERSFSFKIAWEY